MSKSNLMSQLEACGLTFCHIPPGEYEVGAETELKSKTLNTAGNDRALPAITPKQKIQTDGFYISKQLLRLSHWQNLCKKDEGATLQSLLSAEQLNHIKSSIVSENTTSVRPKASVRQINENTVPRPDSLPSWMVSQQLNIDPPIAVDKESASQIAAALQADLPRWYEWEIAARGKEGLLYPWGNEYAPASLALEHQDYSMEDEGVMGFYRYDQEVIFIHDFKEYAQSESPFGLMDLARIGREWNRTNDKYLLPDDNFILRSLSDLGTMAVMVPGIRYSSWRNNPWIYKRAFSRPTLPCYALSTVGENPELGYGHQLYPEAAFRLVIR